MLKPRYLLLDPDKTAGIRETRHLQSTLADNLDVSRQKLSNWLRGVSAIPEDYLVGLCDGLELFFVDLLTEESIEFLQRLDRDVDAYLEEK